MDPTITVALVMASGTIITQGVIAHVSKKSTTDLFNYRLDELTDKMKEHNDFMKRVAIAEKDIKQIRRDVERLECGK